MRGFGIVLIVIGAVLGLLVNLLIGGLLVLIGIGLVVAGGPGKPKPIEMVTGEKTWFYPRCPACNCDMAVGFVTPGPEEFADINAAVSRKQIADCKQCGKSIRATVTFAHPLQRHEPVIALAREEEAP